MIGARQNDFRHDLPPTIRRQVVIGNRVVSSFPGAIGRTTELHRVINQCCNTLYACREVTIPFYPTRLTIAVDLLASHSTSFDSTCGISPHRSNQSRKPKSSSM
jgi:hypothetical protein